jgi:hypothetical protein
MTRLYLLVEGQTEEAFVRELLSPYYNRSGLYLTPIIVSTSPGYKGGVVSYAKIKPQISRLCRQDSTAHVSTLFDLYALPSDFPGKIDHTYPHQGSGTQKAKYLERELANDINESNFIPHLLVHEYEALLFAQPEKFNEWTDDTRVVAHLNSIAEKHTTPEDINGSQLTAPSKRLLKVMPNYKKTFHGPLIACAIGLDVIRQTCPHFNSWLKKLDAL